MKDDATGVDYSLKRRPEPTPQLTIYCFGNALDRELTAAFIENAGVDLLA